jgi:probable addiction module antidote protein
MTRRIKVTDLTEFDAAPYLDGEAAIAAYLTDILEANDPALLASALGDIARARGMSEIAKASGLTREALYKALRTNAKPRYDTITKVCGALGVRLVAQVIPVRASKTKGIARHSRGRARRHAA